MNLDVLIHRYGQQLEILNRSPQTWRTVQVYLRQLQKFFDETKIADVQSVTSATLHDFQRWLFHEPTWKGTMRAVASQNRVLSGVSGFFAFLHGNGNGSVLMNAYSPLCPAATKVQTSMNYMFIRTDPFLNPMKI